MRLPEPQGVTTGRSRHLEASSCLIHGRVHGHYGKGPPAGIWHLLWDMKALKKWIQTAFQSGPPRASTVSPCFKAGTQSTFSSPHYPQALLSDPTPHPGKSKDSLLRNRWRTGTSVASTKTKNRKIRPYFFPRAISKKTGQWEGILWACSTKDPVKGSGENHTSTVSKTEMYRQVWLGSPPLSSTPSLWFWPPTSFLNVPKAFWGCHSYLGSSSILNGASPDLFQALISTSVPDTCPTGSCEGLRPQAHMAISPIASWYWGFVVCVWVCVCVCVF